MPDPQGQGDAADLLKGQIEVQDGGDLLEQWENYLTQRNDD